MTYELAKQLKDAGFPQNFAEKPRIIGKEGIKEKDIASLPTLSELIEACGDNITGIARGKDGWYAQYGIALPTVTREYETPEQAVARLWLELNRDKNYEV